MHCCPQIGRVAYPKFFFRWDISIPREARTGGDKSRQKRGSGHTRVLSTVCRNCHRKLASIARKKLNLEIGHDCQFRDSDSCNELNINSMVWLSASEASELNTTE